MKNELFELSAEDQSQLSQIEQETRGPTLDPAPAKQPDPAPVAPGAPAAKATEPEEHVEGAEDVGGRKMVPLAEVLKERKRRQEMEEQFKTADKRMGILVEKFGQQPGAPAKVEGQPPAKDDGKFKPTVAYEQDPLEYLRQRNDWLEGQVTGVSDRVNKTTEQAAAEREFHAVRTVYATGHESAVKADPTYGQAYNYLFNSQVNRYMALGSSQEQAVETVRAEEFQLARDSLMAQQSPQERIVALAKATGWTPTAAPGGQSPAKSPETLKRGLESTVSLSNAGGAPGGGIDIAALANMSDEEFSRRTDGGNWEKFMNGG